MQEHRLTSQISNDSVCGDYFKDQITISFPLKKFMKVRTEGVSNKEIDSTIKKIIQKQTTSKLESIILIIILTLVGLALCYLGIVIWVIAFLNPFIVLLELVLMVKYFMWMVRAVGMRILKKQKKNVAVLLQNQNKRFYFRKLIKWKMNFQESKILLQNLRG